MDAEEHHPPSGGAGQLLGGRYRLGARLGRGGAATVHTAVDLVLGRAVAVKRYQSVGNATGLHRFAAEARLLAGLSHPGLVTVHDVCLEDDQPYLIMQLVDGLTLRDLLDRGPLPPHVVARFGARLADVLAYIHAHDIVHRDIKPSNVLVDETGACHLADFGIARALSAAHLTVSGEFVGTAAYLAPEQVTDTDTGPAVDVYSLGLLLLECLTGRTEYTGTTVEVALARLARKPHIPDMLPPAWHTLLTAMTAHDPAARPDAARCADLLTRITEEPAAAAPLPAAAAPPPTAAERPVEPPRFWPTRVPRPRPVPIGLTAVALAAAVAAGIATMSPIPGVPSGESPPISTTAPASGDTARTAPDTGATGDRITPAAEIDSPADPATDRPSTTSTTTPTTTETEPVPTTEPTTARQTSTSNRPPPPTTGNEGRGRPSKTKNKGE